MIRLLCLWLLFESVQSYGEDLYSSADPILVLNITNFEKMILCKDHFWIVEFFNRWCGHCIRFAPYWKDFARNIQGWKNVVQVAAIDCADEKNVEICQKYNANLYPTVKLFSVQAQENDPLCEIVIEHNVTFLKHELLDSMNKLWNLEKIPSFWPSLLPVKQDNLIEMWQHHPEKLKTLQLIIESESSYIGQEIILDLSKYNITNVLRVYSNQALAEELHSFIDLSPLPVLLEIKRNGEIKILARGYKDENIRQKFLHVIKPNESFSTIVLPSISSSAFSPQDIKIQTSVYMGDLENALNYSLRQEVGVHQILQGEKLNAIKAYLSTLIKYFPGRLPVMRYLNKLYIWILEQGNEIIVKDMMKSMILMQSDDAYLPPRHDWEGCKGSRPGLRGYPCSLWMLFHTLTVQALYKHYDDGIDNPHKVLFAVRGYVRHFFTCGECSEHFQQMSSNLDNELVNPEDTVLWLWRAHNIVNKRLSTDMDTNDPRYPKIQFPPLALCPLCQNRLHSGNLSWSESHVLRFLMNFYDEKHIVWTGNNPFFFNRRESSLKYVKTLKDTNVQTNSEKNENGKWKFKYFSGADISLCVMLYVISVILLIIVYFLFMLRRQRYKVHKLKMYNVYP